MDITLTHQSQAYTCQLDNAIDISMPLIPNQQGANCFYAPWVEANPVVAGSFIGDTQQGGAVNFKTLKINPHGNGTHTECVGHISQEIYHINDCLKQFHFIGQLISVYPQKTAEGDRCITKVQLEEILDHDCPPALLIRTLPNDDLKLNTNYSGSNPPYFTAEAMAFIVAKGVQHLLVDLPSVDREEDDGKLLAHKAFWQYPTATRTASTITELIYVPPAIKDGLYLVNIQIISIQIDASPSKIVLFPLVKQ